MIVKGRREIRFERRWCDYCAVLEGGTPREVGVDEPRPPDLRKAVVTAFDSGSENRWDVADEVLDQAWNDDARSWPCRLSLFLTPLSRRAHTAFAALVKAGYQPDQLAFQFFEATKVAEYADDEQRVRADLDTLDRLGAQAVASVKALTNRWSQFDEYLLAHRLRVPEGEPGDAELKILLMDLEDLVARHNSDTQHLRRQLDRRRETLLGHAEVRLSRRVREASGAYHDKEVEEVLEELRARRGQSGRGAGALKKRRKRWREALSGRATGEAE